MEKTAEKTATGKGNHEKGDFSCDRMMSLGEKLFFVLD